MSLENPGFHRRKLGDLTITAIFDGTVDVAVENILAVAPERASQLQRDAFRSEPSALHTCFFAVTSGEQTTLIDTGGHASLDSDLGLGLANLRAAGIEPETITRVALTHLHSDHYGGLLRRDGAPAFPNAQLIVPAAERSFRLDPPDLEALTDQQRRTIETVRRFVAPYRDRLLFADPGPVSSGLEAVALPGHTPGHTGWRITSGGERLLIWGDVVHFPAVQFAHPGASMSYDIDPQRAAKSRQAIFAAAARDRSAMAGMHMDFPCFGRVRAESDHYRWVPETCQP